MNCPNCESSNIKQVRGDFFYCFSCGSVWDVPGFSLTKEEREAKVEGAIQSFLGRIKPGNYLVHHDHGTGRFDGVIEMGLSSTGDNKKYAILEYIDGKIYVPVSRLMYLKECTEIDPVMGSLSNVIKEEDESTEV